VEKLKIKPLSDPRIELDAHVVVVYYRARKLAIVGMRRREVRLDVSEQGQYVSVNVERHDQARPVPRNEGRINQTNIGADRPCNMRHNPGRQTVDVVRQEMSSGGLLPVADLGRESHVEHDLEDHPREVTYRRSLAILWPVRLRKLDRPQFINRE